MNIGIERYLKIKSGFEKFLANVFSFLIHNILYAMLYSLIVEGQIISDVQKGLALICFSVFLIPFIIYLLFIIFNRNHNWSRKFYRSLSDIRCNEENFGMPSFMGVSNLVVHPDLILPHKLKDFYGWDLKNDFRLQVVKKDGDSKKYLKLKKNTQLWAGSDSKKISIPLEPCNEKDALHIYFLVIDEGKIMETEDREILVSFPLRKNHLSVHGDHHVFNDRFREELMKKTGVSNIGQIGILSLFMKDAVTGILATVCIGEKSLFFDRPAVSTRKDAARRIASALNNDPDVDGIEVYSLLTYMQSTDDRIEFAKDLSGFIKNRRIRGLNEHEGFELIHAKKDRKTAFSSRLVVLRQDVRSFLNDVFIEDLSGRLYAIFSFIIFNLIIPFLEESDLSSVSIRDLLTYNINKTLSILVYIVILIIYQFLYQTIRWVSRRYQYSKNVIGVLLPDRIITNQTVIPKRNRKGQRQFEPVDYKQMNIVYVDECYGDYRQLHRYMSKELKNEINNGNKYRLISYDADGKGYDLTVDLCKYTDCRTLHLLKDIAEGRKKKDRSDAYLEKARTLFKGYVEKAQELLEEGSSSDVEMLPPNNLCLHMIIVTKDGKVLLTRRRKELNYESGLYDLSIEEQLSSKDFSRDGQIIDVWIKRALEEELGINRFNALKDDYFDAKICSLFLEDKYLNFSLCAMVELKMDSKDLLAILEGWPRSDYEFQYQLIGIRELERYVMGLDRDPEKLNEIVEKWHNSAFNRMLQFSMFYRLKDLNKAVLEIIRVMNEKLAQDE